MDSNHKHISAFLSYWYKGASNAGAVQILPEGFESAPPERISPEMNKKMENLSFQRYRPNHTGVTPIHGCGWLRMRTRVGTGSGAKVFQPEGVRSMSFEKTVEIGRRGSVAAGVGRIQRCRMVESTYHQSSQP
ncbi:hypothetical protein RJ639_029053 [Escallonia herrerae]|uniref:Cytochrome f large domain-containing protein n=1 Tax=Escallonia herrerae TaxID=1293975 RepID=A0AA89BPI5_9ASTE|nr:hypothetical protein RJ639_029053 [Escallonia herrerae]